MRWSDEGDEREKEKDGKKERRVISGGDANKLVTGED